jgi:PAS domain S-box-containing protein
MSHSLPESSPLFAQPLLRHRPTLVRNCVAIAVICASAVLSRLILFQIDVSLEHSFLLLTIGVIGRLAGSGPAMLATLVGVLFSGGFFNNPTEFLSGTRPEQNVGLLLLLLEGSILSGLFRTPGALRTPKPGFPDHRQPESSPIDFRRIVEGVKGSAILLIDPQGSVASWTETAERMTGYSRDEILARPLSLLDVDVANSAATFRRAMQVAKGGGSAAWQSRCVRKDGSEFWADFVIGKVVDSNEVLIGYTAVFRDITARKQAEDLLEQRSRQLIEANRLKDEFLATVSHELRTPLNSILGWAQLFRAGKLDDQGKSHALETIEQSAKTQARLIEDLLDVSRIVTGKMRLDVRPVQMSDVIAAAVETIRPAAEAKSILIRLILEPDGCAVFGDPNRLQQVIWNLLSNAIKFTPQSGTVEIQLRRRESSVQLIVKDNGIGMNAEFLPQAFDAFRQADSSSTRAHKGLGLGLTIVRRLIEMHGGTVRAASDGEGTGTSFEIVLPVASNTKSSPIISTSDPDRRWPEVILPDPGTSNDDMRSVRVVVVDDDPEARELIAAVLAHSGIQVDTFANAAEGLDAVERLKPDVVVSDIEMPEEDGYTFIQNVRALDAEDGGRTPAVALTAYTRAEDRSRSLAAGFQLHLAKPIEANELVNAIVTLAIQRRKGSSHAQATRH